MDISFLFPRCVDSALAGLKEAKNPAAKVLRLIQIFLTTPSFEKISPIRQTNSPQPANHRFEFEKRRQLFIHTHNEALTVVTMRVNNPDRSSSESTAEAQPQLPPALLRLSPIISAVQPNRFAPYLSFCAETVSSRSLKRAAWRNWQTRWTQNSEIADFIRLLVVKSRSRFSWIK